MKKLDKTIRKISESKAKLLTPIEAAKARREGRREALRKLGD